MEFFYEEGKIIFGKIFFFGKGPKTYTVFAPTDAAFAEAVTKTGSALWRESDGPDAAKEIVTRHIIPTTLYTAGMRFYHQKETLREKTPPIHIQKTGGK